jgi:hypothetical protein
MINYGIYPNYLFVFFFNFNCFLIIQRIVNQNCIVKIFYSRKIATRILKENSCLLEFLNIYVIILHIFHAFKILIEILKAIFIIASLVDKNVFICYLTITKRALASLVLHLTLILKIYVYL